MTKKEEWLAGTRSAVPIMLGYVPVGIAYGVMARQAGLNTWQTVLMSLTVYGGASEMMAAGMVAQGSQSSALRDYFGVKTYSSPNTPAPTPRKPVCRTPAPGPRW